MQIPHRPEVVDVHVGRLIRARRLGLGLMQSTVARALGVSFQQIQHYERGDNRTPLARLMALSRVLEVEPTFFFSGLSSSMSRSPAAPIRPIGDMIPDLAVAGAATRASSGDVKRRQAKGGQCFDRPLAKVGVDRAVGNRLRSRRLELGLSQQALAQRVQLAVRQVQKYEVGIPASPIQSCPQHPH